MGIAKPTLGYPTRTAAVMALYEQGLRTSQVAERIGISDATVAALAHSARRASKAHRLSIPAGLYSRLQAAAHARGVRAEDLAHRLLSCALADDLVDAILDDDEAAE